MHNCCKVLPYSYTTHSDVTVVQDGREKVVGKAMQERRAVQAAKVLLAR